MRKHVVMVYLAVLLVCFAAGANAAADADALYQQGKTLYDAQQYTQALPILQEAADLGHAEAQYLLGWAYCMGDGVAQNYPAAMAWWLKAAEQGHAQAQYEIGVMYEYGEGVKEDYREAMAWYAKSAEKGNAAAMNNIGYLYDYGLGVSADAREAYVWYRKSADGGYATGQYNTGLWYLNGYGGVKKDAAEAVKWFTLSAEQNDEWAQYELGVCYEKGLGVQKDLNHALRLYRQAEAGGYEDAAKAVARLAKTVAEFPSPDAERLVRDALDLSTGDVTLKKIKTIKVLDVSALALGDISFLAAYTGLQELTVNTPCSVSDVGSLAKLTALTKLNLEGQPLSDISPLSKLTKLKELNLRNCQISDITLLKKLTRLEALLLGGNTGITDYTPLKGLTKLDPARCDFF
jgi:TPR repeat protein